ncbi:MAG TPA: YtxH domain-containing protein [Candidatus Dormibacteraeota bacterium]|jgi:gas vesicle protein
MADDESGRAGGFGWGLIVGAAIGVAAGVFLASGPGRGQVESLRARTIELTGTARRAASDPENPIGRAINDGISAARRRRQELERVARGRQEGVPVGEEERDA